MDSVGATSEVFFLGAVEDPMAEVLRDPVRSLGLDATRLAGVLEDISGEEPFFVNSHFMQSHGSMFPIAEAHFSRGRTDQPEWDTDYYDDAIRAFDDRFRRVYEQLEASGRLERTILVITSDHGQRTSLLPRLPLLIRFLHAQGAGRFTAKVQRLDIAPTILAALGLEIPSWMEGSSLLDPDALPPERMIFGTQLTRKPIVPVPFDQFLDGNHGVVVIHCDKAFQFPDRILAVTLREPFASVDALEGEGPIPIVDLERSGSYGCTASRSGDLERVVAALRDRFAFAGRVGRTVPVEQVE
jgi:hypothetical protein